MRAERIDERVVAAGAELARRRERLVEAAAHLQQLGAERAGLSELAGGDRALGLEHDRDEAGARRVGGGRGGSVAGRGADDRPGSVLERLRDRNGHPAVLEAPRRVQHLQLEVEVEPEPLREARRRDEWRRALTQRDCGTGGDAQEPFRPVTTR